MGLTAEEYDRIIQQPRARAVTFTELGLFSALWSEHCAYKHSRVFLRRLPTTGPHVLQGPGENAGAIDIGDGLARGLQGREPQPSRRSSSPSRAPPPAWAASCATSSRWARVPSPSSTRCASAILRRPHASADRGVVSGIGRTATVSGAPPWGVRSPSRRSTRATRWSTRWRWGSCASRQDLPGPGRRAWATRSSTSAPRPGATASTAPPWPRHFDETRGRAPAHRAGRGPVHREAPARGVPRGDGDRRRRRHPGHGGGRARPAAPRDGRARRHRDASRPRRSRSARPT